MTDTYIIVRVTIRRVTTLTSVEGLTMTSHTACWRCMGLGKIVSRESDIELECDGCDGRGYVEVKEM